MAKFIQLHPDDDVFIARDNLVSGTSLNGVVIKGLVPAGHKVALRSLSVGQPVRRYNQIIGFASRPIVAGEHVHTQNLGMGPGNGDFPRNSEIGVETRLPSPPRKATFMGIVREDGRVATRNYIGILSSVNCSATVARAIADQFSRKHNHSALAPFPNIDGVVALTHGTGCGMDSQGYGMQLLQRTIFGYAMHPNFAAIVIVGLGCEANQISQLLEHGGLQLGKTLCTFNLQEEGGTSAAVAKGVKLVTAMLPEANRVERVPCDAGHIVVGLQCGGSDGYSGISANPALGVAVDHLVAHGGTAILSETPEIYGAEHLLTRRAISPTVAEKLIKRLEWWENYTSINNGEMNNNPSPGNKAGGLTTILEKSLGAVAKGGSSPLIDVYGYAEHVSVRGLVFMDTPGYDPVSATGQVAGGANLICFTTGRGSAYGCAPAPSLKLATNSALWRRQADDIDINCGEVIDGGRSVSEMGQVIFEQILITASGGKTRSEEHGYGQNEFVPWQIGAVM